MRYSIFSTIVVVIISQFFPLFAQNQTIMDFLKLDIDPVAVGRGGTATSDGEGFNSVFYNPANIDQFKTWDLSYGHRSFPSPAILPDLNYFTVGGVYRFNEKNIVGLYWRKFGFGEFVTTDFMGNIVKRGTAKDFAIGIIYGRKLSSSLTGGLTFKYLRSDMVWAVANGWAIDVGVKWSNLLPNTTLNFPGEGIRKLNFFKPETETKGLNIGCALLNAGPHVHYLSPDQKDPIPQRIRLGIAYHVITSSPLQVQTLFDFEKELVYRPGIYADEFYKAWFTAWKGKTLKEATYHFGVDIRLAYIFNFRWGYQYQPFEDYFNSNVTTIGFGINLKYVSFQYGTWLDRNNLAPLYMDSVVFSVSAGNIVF